MSKWPRLSETLTGPKAVERCQNCGRNFGISRWIECDDSDRKTRVVVCLCVICGDKLIEPHPRLYRELGHEEAWPGTEEVCHGCALRSHTECTSPAAILNGGEGILLGPGNPSRVHLSCVPRSKSRMIWMWPKPLTTCSGFEQAGGDHA